MSFGKSQDDEAFVNAASDEGSKCDRLKEIFSAYAPSMRTVSTGCKYAANITFFAGIVCLAASEVAKANKSDIIDNNQQIADYYAEDPDSQGSGNTQSIIDALDWSSDNVRSVMGETVSFFRDSGIGLLVTGVGTGVAAGVTHVVASKRENSEVEMVFGEDTAGFTPG